MIYNLKKFIVLIIILASVKAQALPVSYDLRAESRISQINNNISGDSWAFAVIGACESNFMTQFPDSSINLSQKNLILNAREFNDEFTTTAILSRMPELYNFRLKDVYFMSRFWPFDPDFISTDTRKNLIMNHGAIYAGIYLDNEKFDKRGKYITYFNNSHERNININALIIGWDDNLPLHYFTPRPTNNGAWLIKSENNYFWTPYEQNIRGGAAFILEKFNPDMRIYLHDELGYCSSIKFSWAANIFRVREDLEYFSEAAFYTPLNNMSWDLYFYECGNIYPDSPVSGLMKAHISGKFELAGYHTVKFPEKISLWQGEYFAVVLKLGRKIMPVETIITNYSDNAIINAKESYFSEDGQKWLDGGNFNSNACIKAFTVIKE